MDTKRLFSPSKLAAVMQSSSSALISLQMSHSFSKAEPSHPTGKLILAISGTNESDLNVCMDTYAVWGFLDQYVRQCSPTA